MAIDQTGKFFGLTTSQTTITSGGWVGISGGPYCNTILVSYLSGATTAVVGSSGISYTFGWILNAGTPLALAGPGNFWITAAGSSSLVNVLKTLNQNAVTGATGTFGG